MGVVICSSALGKNTDVPSMNDFSRLNSTTFSSLVNHQNQKECIPVGCVPAASRPYAGVCFLGGSAPGESAPRGVSALGGEGGVCSGGGACSGGVSTPGRSAAGGVWYPSMH